MKQPGITRVLIIGIMTFWLAACQGKSNSPTTAELEKYIWLLQTIAGQELIPGSRITLEIRGQRISGSGGANRYTAGWTITDDKLGISAIAATKRMMIEPKGVMAQEAEYFRLLEGMQKARITDLVLVLTNDDGVTLKFVPQPEL